MSRLNNLSLIARGFFFVALMAALALTTVQGEAGRRPIEISPPIQAGNTVGAPAIEPSTNPVPDNERPALAPESVVEVPFRITAEGELQKWNVSQWVTLAGLPSRATALATIDESTLYVGTEALGVFKSTDAGNTWVEVNNAGLGLVPGSVLDITALAVDPHNADHVFAATAYLLGSTQIRKVPAGVYESLDGGKTWHALIEGRLPGTVTELRLNPTTPGLVVAHWEAQGDMPLGLTMK